MQGFSPPHASMDTPIFLLFIAGSGALGIGTALSLHSTIMRFPKGTEKMNAFSATIRLSTIAFTKKEWSVIVLCTVLSAILLSFLLEEETAPLIIGEFIFGVLTAFTVSALGLRTALRANVRVLEAARSAPRDASRTAFLSGAVLSLCVSGIGLLALGGSLLVLGIGAEQNLLSSPHTLLGFLLGVASVALFMRTGGGIAAKAADMAADSAEDDPRNPATIVDHVGDNIGNVAGMGTDLYASFVGSIIAAMLIGAETIGTQSAVLFPLIIAATGLLAGIISTICIGAKQRSASLGKTLKRGAFLVTLLVLAAALFFAQQFFPAHMERGISLSVATGLIVGIVVSALAEYYASPAFRPSRQIARAAETGGAGALLLGTALGAVATGASCLSLALAVSIAYGAAGLYGLALAAVGMLSVLALPLAGGAATPVLDNAYGIAVMSRLPHSVRKLTKELHGISSVTAARSRGFALSAGFLTALALFTAFGEAAHLSVTNLLHPLVLVGLFLGALLPFLFSSMIMNAVARTTHALVEEVRRSLKKKTPGNPARCMSIATVVALQEMVTPSLLAVVAPLSVGFLLGSEVLTGLLAGALITALLLATTFIYSGSLWHAAKTAIENGRFGGRKGDAYRVALLGDALGDPLKDVIGPSLLIFVHLMLVVSLLTVELFPTSGLF